MKKTQIILIGATIGILNSGCSMLQPKTQIVDHNTTIEKTIIVPHNDNVKRAVALLIYKMKKLENSSVVNSSHATSSDYNKTMNQLIFNKNEEEKNKRDIAKIRQDIVSLYKLIQSSKTNKKNKDTSATHYSKPKLQKSEYDDIIKDFADQDLK